MEGALGQAHICQGLSSPLRLVSLDMHGLGLHSLVLFFNQVMPELQSSIKMQVGKSK